MAAWLMVSLKTQTLGPKAATFASGQIDEDEDGAGAGPAVAALAGSTANPAPAASAAARDTAGRRSQRPVEPLAVFRTAPPEGRAEANRNWLANRIMASFLLVSQVEVAATGLLGLGGGIPGYR